MMTDYLLWAAAIALAVANGCILHAFGNRDMKSRSDLFFFNGGISALWIVLLGGFSLLLGDLRLSPLSAAYGCVYGGIICLFLLFKNLAMTSGPVSLTTLIGSCPFLLTTLFGVAFLGQSINGFQIAGIGLIVVSLLLCVRPGRGEKKPSPRWLLHSAVFFLAGGMVGILYMLFGASSAAGEINGMMLCAAVTACALYALLGLCFGKGAGRPRVRMEKSWAPFILLCGVASCAYMRMNLYLSTVIPSVVFFPVANGAVVIFSTVTGVVLFKERLTPAQLTGMLLGLAALVITGSGSALAALL